MAESWFTVFVAAEGPALPENAAPSGGEGPVLTWPLDNLARAARELEGAAGGVAGWGGPAGGPNLQLSVQAEDVAAAAAMTTDVFERARRDGGIAIHPVVHLEVLSEDVRDRLLDEPGSLRS